MLYHVETKSIRIHNVQNDLVADAKRAAQLSGLTFSGWVIEAMQLRLHKPAKAVEAVPRPPIVERAVERAGPTHDTKNCRIYGCLICKELRA